jgi:N6-adenosine-specific RNA methylase IME4
VKAVTVTKDAVQISGDLGFRGRVLRVGWELPSDLSEAEWREAGAILGRVEHSVSWWLGDWWAHGEKHYGDRKAIVEADDWDGPAFQTCVNAGNVCKKFKETNRRRLALSFKHHAEVADRPPEEADRLLDWCEETIAATGKPRSTAELRKEVRASVRAEKKAAYIERIAAAKPKPLEGTYRVLYLDPPWKYHGLNQADEYGHAEAHYDCLDDDQLCWFRPGQPKTEYHPDGKGRLIKNLADENAILFLWVTAPLMKRCFPILEAWGFEYKAQFIWDKIDHVMGFYNSVRHEHLLIATKGSAITPDEKRLFDSVQSIKRTEHSKKPPEFYDIIDTLYDHGRRLELFSRSGREGWDSWGNETGYLKSTA